MMTSEPIVPNIPGFSEAIANFGNLRQVDFNRMIEARWFDSPVERSYKYALEVVLAHEVNATPSLFMVLRFDGVQGLRFGPSRSLFIGITDISSRGWEDLFYSVKDYEGASELTFNCRDVRVISIAPFFLSIRGGVVVPRDATDVAANSSAPDENTIFAQPFTWDIRRGGHAWGDATMQRYLDDYPEKPEVSGGKLFWTEADRLNVLAMLLENVGVDKAVRLGNPQVWRDAVQEI